MPITSSASKPSAPPVQMPNASRSSVDHLDLRGQVVGHLLDIGLPAGVFLFDPMRLVRRDAIDPELRAPVEVQADHQPAGLCRVITVATESMKPRTALTGRPSGEVIEDGTPKKERNHMLAPSSSSSGADMPSSCQSCGPIAALLPSRYASESPASLTHGF